MRAITMLRWLARIWGLALLAVAIVMLISPDPNRRPDVQPIEFLIPALLIGGAVVGSLLAWCWEWQGGLVVVAGWLSSLVADHFIYGRWLPPDVVGLTALFFATPGFLFLLCCWLACRHSLERED